ncbi:hypothetical protein HII31_01360 [Pseudocercospora fuligena]|uniref:Threonylcarbamoyl-AMP synthase n=1 Tax=Pseudocercospora fuligena TaxID=685502 RepID=A0A8H6VQY8_9PEZI|nr:hypothetical protein HII31_01360 [Pseudocercospora fuligena]
MASVASKLSSVKIPDVEEDTKRVFAVLQQGGLAIIPVSVGYAIVATDSVALERAFTTKQRGAHKRHAMIGSYALHRSIHVLPPREQSMVDFLIRDLKIPLGLIPPFKPDHPIIQKLGPETLARSSVEGTLAMLCNGGRFMDELSRLATEAGVPLMGSSANMTGKGTKAYAEEIEPEILEAADIIINYGKQKYNTPRTSSSMIDFRGPSLVRFGACYDTIRDVMKRFYGVEFPEDPGKDTLFSGHATEAQNKIEALATRTGAIIHWRPVLLGAIYRATNAPQGAAGSASDVFNPTKKSITSRAFQLTIKRHGLPHNEPPRHPHKTTAALRLLYFIAENDRPALTHALYKAYWVEGRNVGERETLLRAVREAKISKLGSVIHAVHSGEFEGEKQRRKLESSTEDAVKRGSPGVPGFWIGDEIWTDRDGARKKGRLYWGQDRMPFVEAVVLALKDGKSGDELSQVPRPLRSLFPRAIHQSSIPANEEVKLEFWYDFSSPWAFLGWTQLASLQRRFGERLQIEMKPFLLGILFREIGAPNLPMAAISEHKRNYMRLDHGDWVRWWNAINLQEGKPDKSVDFYWADNFPIRTPSVLRVALARPELAGLLYRACWERNLDMSKDEVLESVLSEAGHDAKGIMKEANSQKIKADLRARTKEAKETGICGVPTYRVFRRKVGEKEWKQTGDLVWGQDELNVVEDLIAGWDGTGVASVGDVGSAQASAPGIMRAGDGNSDGEKEKASAPGIMRAKF